MPHKQEQFLMRRNGHPGKVEDNSLKVCRLAKQSLMGVRENFNAERAHRRQNGFEIVREFAVDRLRELRVSEPPFRR